MLPVDERVGFAQAGLGRNYHRLEQVGDAGIEQDLAPALRVVEVGKQAEPVSAARCRRTACDALGRREGDLAHAVHVDAGHMERPAGRAPPGRA